MSVSSKCIYCIVIVFDEIFILHLGSVEISLTDFNDPDNNLYLTAVDHKIM